MLISFKRQNRNEAGTPMERDTVGKLSSDLLQRDIYGDHSAGEQMQEQLGEYESGLSDCVNRGKSDFAGDFFVTVITKRERLMPNVIRNYFFNRLSCPSPDYDQTLYHYHRSDDHLEFVWVIPSPVAVKDIMKHRHDIDISFYALLKFVLEFLDGTLEAKARTLNNEPPIKKEMVHDRRVSTT
jgi:hypothetical protein